MARSKEHKENGVAQELVLGGELTVRRIAALKVELEQALAAGGALQLRLEEVAEVDLAFLQLLCAAYRQAVRRKQAFRVTGDTAGCFAEALRLGGFVPQGGIAADGFPGCLGQMAAVKK